MTEVVDGLPQQVATVALVGGNLRHREVGLGQFGAGGVHTNENLGDGLDVEVLGQLDDTDVVVDYFAQLLQHAEERVFVYNGVGGCVRLGDL